MTDRRDIIRQITEMLGGQADDWMPEAMYAELIDANSITIDHLGQISVDDYTWELSLSAVIEKGKPA